MNLLEKVLRLTVEMFLACIIGELIEEINKSHKFKLYQLSPVWHLLKKYSCICSKGLWECQDSRKGFMYLCKQ